MEKLVDSRQSPLPEAVFCFLENNSNTHYQGKANAILTISTLSNDRARRYSIGALN